MEFSPGANVEGDDTVQQVGVVTFNALQKEIAMKEQKFGNKERRWKQWWLRGPKLYSSIDGGDLEDEEDGDDDSSGTMGV